jgi:hypothetical protein
MANTPFIHNLTSELLNKIFEEVLDKPGDTVFIRPVAGFRLEQIPLRQCVHALAQNNLRKLKVERYTRAAFSPTALSRFVHCQKSDGALTLFVDTHKYTYVKQFELAPQTSLVASSNSGPVSTLRLFFST